MVQNATLGIVMVGPFFSWEHLANIPAIYPTSDLFLAPFLAQLANMIDKVL
jgi:hypothetical protein